MPESAFSPPQGFGAAEAHGLKGDYFTSPRMERLVATRLDAAIDMILDRRKLREVVADLLAKFENRPNPAAQTG